MSQSSNFCNVDSDCKVLPLGGKYVEWGCYHYINKNIDGEQLYEKMDNYWDKCTRIIDDCDPGPEAKCEKGKCVLKQKEDNSITQLTDCSREPGNIKECSWGFVCYDAISGGLGPDGPLPAESIGGDKKCHKECLTTLHHNTSLLFKVV